MYNPPDVCWDILNDIMSQHYLHIQHIFGLKGLVLWVGAVVALGHKRSIAASSQDWDLHLGFQSKSCPHFSSPVVNSHLQQSNVDGLKTHGIDISILKKQPKS